MLILEGHRSPVYCLVFSPDSYLLASGAKDGGLVVWDPSGAEVRSFGSSPPSARLAVAFSASDGRFAFNSGNEFTEAGRPDGLMIRGSSGSDTAAATVTGLAYLDAATLAVGTGLRGKSEPGWLYLWDLSKRKRREPAVREPHGVRAVAAHPPTRTVAWVNGSRRATVWDVTKPDPVHFNLTHTSPAVAFHPDGTMIAVAQEWGARVLDIPRRQERAAVKGHKGQVTSVAFSPDGRTLATGSWDGTVRLWDPLTGAERQAFQWPTGRVYALAYAPDGTRLAAAGERGTIVVWDTE